MWKRLVEEIRFQDFRDFLFLLPISSNSFLTYFVFLQQNSNSYDSMSSYDSYNNRFGPNAHDDLKSSGPRSHDPSPRSHDPYRFTRSTAQPLTKEVLTLGNAKPQNSDYQKYRLGCNLICFSIVRRLPTFFFIYFLLLNHNCFEWYSQMAGGSYKRFNNEGALRLRSNDENLENLFLQYLGLSFWLIKYQKKLLLLI